MALDTAPASAVAAGAFVCLPVSGWHDLARRCLTALLEHTPPGVPIVVADDADPEDGLRRWAQALHRAGADGGRLFWRRAPSSQGFPATVAQLAAEFHRVDLVLLDAESVVEDAWFSRLGTAAGAGADLATASALTRPGAFNIVPAAACQGDALAHGEMRSTDGTAALRGVGAHPGIPAAEPGCTWLRRSALDLTGGLRPDLPALHVALTEFSERCRTLGLRHVLATDVQVRRTPPLSADHPSAVAAAAQKREALGGRAPHLRAVRDATTDAVRRGAGELGRALTASERRGRRMTVTLDGGGLEGPVGGAQARALQTLRALARRDDLRIRVLVPQHPGPAVAEVLSTVDVELLDRRDHLEALDAGRRAMDDIVHRLTPVGVQEDLTLLLRSGRRVVLTQPALARFDDPARFPDVAAWTVHRRLTAESLAYADRTVFLSDHALASARKRDLIDLGQAAVVAPGAEPLALGPSGHVVEPIGQGEPYLLVLGSDRPDRNRLFALATYEALRERHAWSGRLLLAGPAVIDASRCREDAWLAARPELAPGVLRLAAADGSARAALLRDAALLLYPATSTTFGGPVLEAAQEGTPAMFAPVPSLHATIGTEAATIVPWDPVATAARAARLLDGLDDPARLVKMLGDVAEALRWDATADALVGVYDSALQDVQPGARRLFGEPTPPEDPSRRPPDEPAPARLAVVRRFTPRSLRAR